MEGFAILLVLFIVTAVLCGPIALIIIAVTSGRLREIAEEQRSLKGQINELQRTMRQLKTTGATEEVKVTPHVRTAAPTPAPAPVPVPMPAPKPVVVQPTAPTQPKVEPVAPKPEPVRPIVQEKKPESTLPLRAVAAAAPGPKPVIAVKKPDIRLEERIGTRWILIAGVVTSFIGVAFFLKFAYDKGLIGPLGRTIMATIAGLACLVTGEVTRRRGYELVAKGVTALGFAILYVTVFFTCKWLDPPLISIEMAFVLAALITAAAMTYAVVLDEIWIAGLSLLGGFLSPAILSTGVNAANALFGYVLVLGGGACACAIFRRWRVINALAFVGTWLLYAGWFMSFYVSPQDAAMYAKESQLAVAMVWLGVFFAVYLVMPLLYGLANRAIARREDVSLVAANATIVFGYAARMLYSDYREWLALAAIVMAAAHAAVAIVAAIRSREDKDLRLTLLTIATAFVTMAVPLYFKTNAVVLAWAAEAVVLVFIGLRYGSLWTQTMGVAAMALAVWKLVFVLPWHTGQFTPIFNSVFGTWLFVVAAIAVCHILYRRRTALHPMMAEYASQLYYCAGVVLLITAVWQEWHFYCHTLAGNGNLLLGGRSVIMAFGLLLAAWRPLRPAGVICDLFGGCAAALGAFYVLSSPVHPAIHVPAMVWAVVGIALVVAGIRLVCTWTQVIGAVAIATGIGSLAIALPMHEEAFTPVFNGQFLSWCFVVAAAAICHVLYRRRTALSPEFGYASQLYYCGVVVLLMVAVWQEWQGHYNYNMAGYREGWLHGGGSIILAVGLLIAAGKPLRPAGTICDALGGLIAAYGTIYMLSFPLHLRVHVPAMVWAVVGIALVLAGIRVACTWTQILGAAAIAISFGGLATALPLHITVFTPVFNGQFLSWCFVVATLAACHVVYRRLKTAKTEEVSIVNQAYYIAALVLLMAAVSLEWHAYCYENVARSTTLDETAIHSMYPMCSCPDELPGIYAETLSARGQLVIFGLALVLASLRPVRPKGILCNGLAGIIAVVGSLLAIAAFKDYHAESFTIFANGGFVVAAFFVATAAASAKHLYGMKGEGFAGIMAKWMGVGLVVLSWLLISMEIYWFWYWRGRTEPAAQNWEFMMQMCISISWAIYAAALTVVGFWRGIAILRYMALGLFALLLAKVFIIDTSSIKNVYRMGAFLATGIILVLVSYLYQFLKKKGFFEPKP